MTKKKLKKKIKELKEDIQALTGDSWIKKKKAEVEYKYKYKKDIETNIWFGSGLSYP